MVGTTTSHYKVIEKIGQGGDVPSPLDPPTECRFDPLCPLAVDIPKQEEPRETEVNGHKVWGHVSSSS